jgi:hypothetical protein
MRSASRAETDRSRCPAAAQAHGRLRLHPGGKRNHFALDVGVATFSDVGALDARSLRPRALDRRGGVNSRVFLNNVSLGIWRCRQSTATPKRARCFETTAQTLDRLRRLDLQLVDDRGHTHRDPAVVLVSAQPYAPTPACARHATFLGSGRLGIIVSTSGARAGAQGGAGRRRFSR